MRSTIAFFLFTILALSATVLAAPKPVSGRQSTRALKQATRQSVINRMQNPLRRVSTVSCGTCLDCCEGFCSGTGQTQHAVYTDTGITLSGAFGTGPIGGPATQTTLESCIRSCCFSLICNAVTYIESTSQCQMYQADSESIYTTETGTTFVANAISCQDNIAQGGERQCCNAPLVIMPAP